MGDLVNVWSILFSIINFAVVYYILEKTLFGKVANNLHERQDRIAKSLEDAKAVEQIMTEIEDKRKQIIADANKEASEIVAKYTKEGEQITVDLKNKAAIEIAKLETDAELKLAANREEMITTLKTEAADLAIMGAEKIIDQKLTEKEDKVLIEKYLEQIK